MSLSDAVLEVAKGMETESEGSDPSTSRMIRSFVRELRTAVKAAEGVQEASKIIIPSQPDLLTLAKLEEEKRDMRARTRIQENHGGCMIQLVGGGSDGTMADGPIPGSPIDQTRMRVGGEIYVLRKDGCMHYSEEDTAKFRKSKGK